MEKGLTSGFAAVLAVSLIDALFIGLSIIGTTLLIMKWRKQIQYIGALVLLFFGIRTIGGALGESVAPPTMTEQISYLGTFMNALLLTASNPLTIIFWSGLFTTKVVDEKFSRKDEIYFGLGAVLATFAFLSSVTLLGQVTKSFLSPSIITVLNIIVGLFLIGYGLRLFLKTRSD